MEYAVYFSHVQVVVDAPSTEEAELKAADRLGEVALDWRVQQVDEY